MGHAPEATEQLPSGGRRKTVVDVASPFPAIVEALQIAISAVQARARPEVDATCTNDSP